VQTNCSIYSCISFLLLGHVEKSPVLSGLMLPLCRSFLSNSSEAESFSTERIPNQIPFYSCLPSLFTRNHTALQHTNICPHSSLQFFSFLSLSATFAAPSTNNHTTISHPFFLQSINSTIVGLNIKKQNCGRIPPVQVSVMCCDERTRRQRDLLIMKHRGPKLPH